jgi:mRNA interferase MazF
MSTKKYFDRGDIVLVPFPFSDLSKNKVRPALVLASDKEDYVFIFITTVKPKSSLFVVVTPSGSNNLKVLSYIRYTKLASLDSSIILGKIGSLSDHDFKIVKKNVQEYLYL